MSEGTTIEFSTFGIDNPLKRKPDSMAAYVDTYLHATPKESLKKRNQSFKWKQLLSDNGGLDVFTYHILQDNQEGLDSLDSFLKFHNLTDALQWPGINVYK